MLVNTIIQGNCIETLKTLPDNYVNCCVTSPPYYNLRDYNCNGQIGLEETPQEYIQKLIDVFREVKRVLSDNGTAWINIGDIYAGSGKGAANYPENAKLYKQGTNKGMLGATATLECKTPGIKNKDLIGIPWMLAFALRDDGWYLRQSIIWHKPNAMPESVTDRCTKSHEYILLLSKSARYYFDSNAIKEPVAESSVKRIQIEKKLPRYGGKKYTENPDVFYRTKSGNAYDFRPERNKRDVWVVNNKPFNGAHFAVFPEKLILPCILSGCPENGIVLDPFMGSGTTALVAIKNLRKYIGCELNPEYIKIAEQRIANEKGLF